MRKSTEKRKKIYIIMHIKSTYILHLPLNRYFHYHNEVTVIILKNLHLIIAELILFVLQKGMFIRIFCLILTRKLLR